MATLETLNCDNSILRSLPLDPSQENILRDVKGACYTIVDPTPVSNPQTVVVSQLALDLLDLNDGEADRPEFAEYFSGNKLLPGSRPAAHCYCGHQRGLFVGQLGDGATMYLGEVVNSRGERWELQLKGAGPTPYSKGAEGRTGDGRKVLRSVIREFLCSEAMYHLGVPTMRAASCVLSDTPVTRDIYFDGRDANERGAVMARIGPSFIRFGSFQICNPPDPLTGNSGPNNGGNLDLLGQLTDFVVQNFYPGIWTAHQDDKATLAVEFFREVVHRTARLVASWQCVGWVHSVLNTDNMSILGLTLDYGPFTFLDRYDPDFVSNVADVAGYNSYKNQPAVCKWNLGRLAESLSLQPHVDQAELGEVLEEYQGVYEDEYRTIMRRKLGLKTILPDDEALFSSFYSTMYRTGADFTNSFRCLSALGLPGTCYHGDSVRDVTDRLLDQCCPLEELVKAHKLHVGPDNEQRMKVADLIEKTPISKANEDRELWTRWLTRYVARLERDIEGSTEPLSKADRKRKDVMDSANPRFILRNYIAQNAIDAALTGDYSETERVLEMLRDPYGKMADLISNELNGDALVEENGVSPDLEKTSRSRTCPLSRRSYDSRPPGWALGIALT